MIVNVIICPRPALGKGEVVSSILTGSTTIDLVVIRVWNVPQSGGVCRVSRAAEPIARSPVEPRAGANSRGDCQRTARLKTTRAVLPSVQSHLRSDLGKRPRCLRGKETETLDAIAARLHPSRAA